MLGLLLNIGDYCEIKGKGEGEGEDRRRLEEPSFKFKYIISSFLKLLLRFHKNYIFIKSVVVECIISTDDTFATLNCIHKAFHTTPFFLLNVASILCSSFCGLDSSFNILRRNGICRVLSRIALDRIMVGFIIFALCTFPTFAALAFSTSAFIILGFISPTFTNFGFIVLRLITLGFTILASIPLGFIILTLLILGLNILPTLRK